MEIWNKVKMEIILPINGDVLVWIFLDQSSFVFIKIDTLPIYIIRTYLIYLTIGFITKAKGLNNTVNTISDRSLMAKLGKCTYWE